LVVAITATKTLATTVVQPLMHTQPPHTHAQQQLLLLQAPTTTPTAAKTRMSRHGSPLGKRLERGQRLATRGSQAQPLGCPKRCSSEGVRVV